MIASPWQEPTGQHHPEETAPHETSSDRLRQTGRPGPESLNDQAQSNDQAQRDEVQNNVSLSDEAQSDEAPNDEAQSHEAQSHEARKTSLAVKNRAASGYALAHPDALTNAVLGGDASANGADAAIAVRMPATVVSPPSLPPATIPQPSPPLARLAASYDALREALAAHPLRRRSLFLTSTGPREGTTTTALNLARGFAREANVLLVELRFTQPRLRQQLGQSLSTPGLEEGLRSVVSLGDCIIQDVQSTLSTLTMKGPLSAQEAFHQSGPLNDLLQWAEERFDWLVLDCPPVGSPEWTLWFDLNADPVLLIVRSGVTHERAVRKAGRRLQDRLAGAVLLQP